MNSEFKMGVKIVPGDTVKIREACVGRFDDWYRHRGEYGKVINIDTPETHDDLNIEIVWEDTERSRSSYEHLIKRKTLKEMVGGLE